MASLRGLAAGLLVLAASGCAQKPDWIEGTLVTVDINGVWEGMAVPMTSQRAVPVELHMNLRHSGAKVTGEGRFGITNIKIEGTVRGDMFSFSVLGKPMRADATVTGDEMAGRGVGAQGFGEFTLKLSRQPATWNR